MTDTVRKSLLGIVCFCSIVGVGLIAMLIMQYLEYERGVKVYGQIEEENVTTSINEADAPTQPVQIFSNVSKVITQTEDSISYELPALDIDMKSLIDMNPDFIGWIYIPNTRISYPVVRSHDNIEYTYTMFNGERNAAGTIFSDCRTAYPFIQHTILYGHNMKNGTMFKDIYTMEKAVQNYPDLWVYLVDGTIFHYNITAIQRVHKADPNIYKITKGESSELILSTCVNNDTRLVVITQRDWAYKP